MADFQGVLAPRLQGGSLEVQDGSGGCTAFAQDATLRFTGWAGALRFHGRNGTVEARGTGGARAPWRIEGTDLQVILDDVGGGVVANLDGGGFRGSDLGGRLQAVAKNGARLDLADLAAGVQLSLSDGAEARVRGVGGELRAELEDAALDADGVFRLVLTAVRSRATVRGIERLARLEATDADLDLDLSALVHSPSLQLRGASRATVLLPTPCLVRPQGPSAMLDDRIRITGCDLLLPGQRMRDREALIRYGDRRLTTLTPLLSEDSSLEIEGRP